MEGLSDVTSGIKSSITSVFNIIKNIYDFIVSIPQLIIDGITEVLKTLFIPQNNYFNEKITNFKEHFGFVTSIVEGASAFIDVFKNEEIGTIEIDLQDINSKYDFGGKVYVLSFDWYTPYKERGDEIISCFLWVAFFINTYKSLSSIINGGSSSDTKEGGGN